MSANSVPKVTTNSGKAVCDSNVFLHLDLICFNLRGILPNRAYLHHLCSNYKAIICLSEHWLHSFQSNIISNIHPDYLYDIECVPDCEDRNFCFPRNLRGHGGVAILWHRSLNHVVKPVHFPRSERILGIRLLCFPIDLIIFSIYLPTRSGSTEPFQAELDVLDSAFIRYPECALLFSGDFNADIGSPSSSTSLPNEQGKVLLRYLNRWDYSSSHLSSPVSPTYTYESDAHNSLSTIDHIMCPNFLLSKLISSKVLANHPLNVSDHLPVYSCFSISLSPPPAVTSGFSTPLTRSVLRWCNTDSRLIQSYSQAVDRALQSVSCDIHTPLDIELLSSSVSNALLSAGKDHIPSSKHHSYIRPNWSSDLKTAHNTSKQKYREWCLGGKPDNPSHPIKMAYKEAKRSFRRAFRKSQRCEVDELYNSLDLSNPNIFTVIKRKLGYKPAPVSTLFFDHQTYRDSGLPEAWARYFELLYTPKDHQYDTDHKNAVDSQVCALLDSPLNVGDTLTFSPEEIRAIVSSLPPQKASGPDHVSNEHLLHAPASVFTALAALFNGILRLHHVPSSFTSSLIIPLFKGGGKDPTLPNSYRGISLSSNLSKLFEKLLLDSLQNILLPSIHPLQGGFRQSYSTFHTSFILHEAISECKHRHSTPYLALLDVQKAFDTVWHNGLFLKLFQLGLRGDIWFTLYNWYRRISSSVLWNDSVSRSFPVLQGVRQGAVLSPLLYSVFTTELLSILEGSGLGVYIGACFVGAPTYADDMALVAASPWELQTLINLVYSYSYKWRYSINSNKSHVLIFTQRHALPPAFR